MSELLYRVLIPIMDAPAPPPRDGYVSYDPATGDIRSVSMVRDDDQRFDVLVVPEEVALSFLNGERTVDDWFVHPETPLRAASLEPRRVRMLDHLDPGLVAIPQGNMVGMLHVEINPADGTVSVAIPDHAPDTETRIDTFDLIFARNADPTTMVEIITIDARMLAREGSVVAKATRPLTGIGCLFMRRVAWNTTFRSHSSTTFSHTGRRDALIRVPNWTGALDDLPPCLLIVRETNGLRMVLWKDGGARHDLNHRLFVVLTTATRDINTIVGKAVLPIDALERSSYFLTIEPGHIFVPPLFETMFVIDRDIDRMSARV